MTSAIKQAESEVAALYDVDFYSWATCQTKALIELREFASRHRFNGIVDWDNLIEEVEDLAKSQLRSVGSFLKNTVSHLLYIANYPTDSACKSWQDEIITWRKQMRDTIAENPGATHHITDEFIISKWGSAVRDYVDKFPLTKKEKIVLLRELENNMRWTAEEICGFNPQVREQDMPTYIPPSLPDELVDVLIEANVDWKFAERYSTVYHE